MIGSAQGHRTQPSDPLRKAPVQSNRDVFPCVDKKTKCCSYLSWRGFTHFLNFGLWSRPKHVCENTINLSLRQTLNMQLQIKTQNSEYVRTSNWDTNLAFIIAHCTNECLQLIPLRFLETILSHVEMLFGAICHGKRDRIYYLLHNIIAGLGILLKWERSQKSPF